MKNKNAQIGSTLSMFVMIIVVIIILVTFALISGIVKNSVFSKGEEREKDRLSMDIAYDMLYEGFSNYLFENEHDEVVCDDFFVVVASAIKGNSYFKREGENLIFCLENGDCKVLDKNIISASELQIFLTNFQEVRINGAKNEIIIVLNGNNNDENNIEFMFTLCAISEGCVLDYGKWISQQRVSIENGDYFEKNEKLKEFLSKGEEYTSNPKHKMELLWEVIGGEKYNC